MATLNDLQTAVAREADTPKSKISVAVVSRVLKILWKVLEARPDLICVVERMLVRARKASSD